MGHVNPSFGSLAAREDHIVLEVSQTRLRILAKREVNVGLQWRCIAITVHIWETSSKSSISRVLNTNTMQTSESEVWRGVRIVRESTERVEWCLHLCPGRWRHHPRRLLFPLSIELNPELLAFGDRAVFAELEHLGVLHFRLIFSISLAPLR